MTFSEQMYYWKQCFDFMNQEKKMQSEQTYWKVHYELNGSDVQQELPAIVDTEHLAEIVRVLARSGKRGPKSIRIETRICPPGQEIF